MCIFWLKFNNVLSRQKGLFVVFVKISRTLNFVVYTYMVFNFDEDERRDDNDNNNNNYYYYYYYYYYCYERIIKYEDLVIEIQLM